MNTSFYPRLIIVILLFLTATVTFAQTNAEKIKASWSVESFDAEKDSPQAEKAKQELSGICLTFGSEELEISKKTGPGDSLIKRGKYFLAGNSLALGNDRADILLLSEKSLVIKIPGQGILRLRKI